MNARYQILRKKKLITILNIKDNKIRIFQMFLKKKDLKKKNIFSIFYNLFRQNIKTKNGWLVTRASIF